MTKGYQSFKQKSTRTVFCSSSKFASHADAKEWVTASLAHFGIQASDTTDYRYPLGSQPAGTTIWPAGRGNSVLITLSGLVVDDNNLPQSGLRVEAWDNDAIGKDDYLGSYVLDENGNFSIIVNPADHRELFLDRYPDVYFKIYSDNNLLLSSEHEVHKNLKESTFFNFTVPKKLTVLKVKKLGARTTSDSNTFSKSFPEELRAARIGTCYNSLTQTLESSVQAFDLGKLNKGELLKFVSGTGTFEFSANSMSTAHSEKSFLSVDIKTKASFWGLKVAAGFNMARAHASAKEQRSIKALLSYIFKGQFIELLHADDEALYECMTDSFRRAYDRVVTSETSKEYSINYFKFTKVFGHGCITKLHLTSGSIAEISITTNDAADSSSNKYGTSLMVSSLGGGITSAVAWGKEINDATRGANVSIRVDSIPENTPTLSWVKEVSDRFTGIAIGELAKSATYAGLPSGFTVEAPKFPDPKDWEGQKIPKPKSDEDFGEDIKKELMKEDKFVGNWKEYIEKQKEIAKEAFPEKVNREAATAVSSRDRVLKNSSMLGVPNSSLLTTNKSAPRLRSLNSSSLDLGGYIPNNFEITPWDMLFPNLKAKLYSTLSGINIAKIQIFYNARLQFAQYLYFLVDIDLKNYGNINLKDDADKYLTHCKEFLDRMLLAIENHPFDGHQYQALLVEFEEELNNLADFKSKKVYETFFKHYDFFSKYPFGFLYLFEVEGFKSKFYIADKKKEDSYGFRPSKEKSLSDMLQDAVRQYPIITPLGELALGSYIGNSEKENGWFYFAKSYFKLNKLYPEEYNIDGRYIDFTFLHGLSNDAIFNEDFKTPPTSLREPSAFVTIMTWSPFKRSQNDLKLDIREMERVLIDNGRGGSRFEEIYRDKDDFSVLYHFKGIGYNDFPKNDPNLKIRGKAMWENFPFEDLQKSLQTAIDLAK